MKIKTMLLAAAAALAIATPLTAAEAKDITINLNDNEQAAFLQILDLAAKSGGLQVATNVAVLYQKVVTAASAADKPTSAEVPDKSSDSPPAK